MIRKKKATGVLASLIENINEESLERTRNRMMIAKKISMAIKSKGYTQKQFAAIMGKTESEISEWLSGDRNFTIDTLTDIGRTLNINLLNLSSMYICSIPRETKCTVKQSKTTHISEFGVYCISDTAHSSKDYLSAVS